MGRVSVRPSSSGNMPPIIIVHIALGRGFRLDKQSKPRAFNFSPVRMPIFCSVCLKLSASYLSKLNWSSSVKQQQSRDPTVLVSNEVSWPILHLCSCRTPSCPNNCNPSLHSIGFLSELYEASSGNSILMSISTVLSNRCIELFGRTPL